MNPGVFFVQSRPSSTDDADAFNTWYDDAHIPELISLDGFTGARRFERTDESGETTYLTLYEVDDIETAKASLAAARAESWMSPPVALQMDPPPIAQWFSRRNG